MILLLGAGAALAALVDVGSGAARPAALIVETPGFAPAAYDPLSATIEGFGVDAWRLALGPDEQTDGAALRAIDAALTTLRASGRPVALVGHGIGGRLAARAVAERGVVPDALGLLGAPLDYRVLGDAPVALVAWMSLLPLPDRPLDLGELTGALWRDQPALSLLLGDPLPPLTSVSPTFLAALQADVRSGRVVDLKGAPCPIWTVASQRDNLAPPEAVRAANGDGAFVRAGYLHLDPREPDHAGLLTEPVVLRNLARWLRAQLRGAAR